MQIVINTPGTKLNVDNGMLMVSNSKEQQRLSLKGITSILLYKGCSITSDLVYIAIENNIDIVFGTRTGKPAARLWASQFGSIASIRKKQVLFSQSDQCGEFVKGLILQKIKHQIAVLVLLFKPNKSTDKIINESILFLEKYLEKLIEEEVIVLQEKADKLRGWEGCCSKRYFECINLHLPGECSIKCVNSLHHPRFLGVSLRGDDWRP